MATFKTMKDILNEVNLTGEVNQFLFSGDDEKGKRPVMQRKPTNFADLGPARSTRSMPKDVKKFLDGLPTITWKDVYGGTQPFKGDEFWRPHKGVFQITTPQWFKIKVGSKIIVVDTEGYDVPRFAAFIKK